MLQKLVIDKNGEINVNQLEEFKIAHVKEGGKLFILAGYCHLVVNT